MWRIAVFLVSALAAFAVLTGIVLAFVEVGLTWAAITVTIAGPCALAVLAFPTLTWVVEGRWHGFYRRKS